MQNVEAVFNCRDSNEEFVNYCREAPANMNKCEGNTSEEDVLPNSSVEENEMVKKEQIVEAITSNVASKSYQEVIVDTDFTKDDECETLASSSNAFNCSHSHILQPEMVKYETPSLFQLQNKPSMPTSVETVTEFHKQNARTKMRPPQSVVGPLLAGPYFKQFMILICYTGADFNKYLSI